MNPTVLILSAKLFIIELLNVHFAGIGFVGLAFDALKLSFFKNTHEIDIQVLLRVY